MRKSPLKQMETDKSVTAVNINIPEKLGQLFEPARYKVLHGGRGSAKSWSIAQIFLVDGMKDRMRFLCVRELQVSIKDSVHKLLKDLIHDLNLEHFYTVTQTSIVGKNGTEFIFEGLRHNVAKIKSYEGIDRVWVEEAHLVSKISWEVLIPTIRKDDSEIWVSFNPELESDETYQRFVMAPPSSAIVIEINWRDNPWFPEVLYNEMMELKARDYDSYLTVWEGKCRQALEGAVYADEIRDATLQGRISAKILHDRTRPITLTFDLGHKDMCSSWGLQQIGMEHHAIDFYENCGKAIDHYLEHWQRKQYIIGKILLPHDGAHETQAAAKVGSIETQVRRAMPNATVLIVPRISNLATGVNAVRALFPRLFFNESECSDGLHCLRHYRYGIHPKTRNRTNDPVHDWSSHAAKALEGYAVYLREGFERRAPKGVKLTPPRQRHPQSWMGA